MLVHPKDKLDTKQKRDPMYEIPCVDCCKSYFGETGQPFGVRLSEHQKKINKLESVHCTRSTSKASVTEHHKSVTEHHKSTIPDHVVATNHSIDWKKAKVIDCKADKCTRWLKEAIWIHRRGKQTLSKDEGSTNYIGPMIYSFLPGLSGVFIKYCLANVLPSGYLGCAGRRESK